MTDDPRLRSAPATLRNREPLLAVLRAALPAAGTVLEVASGTGEHAAYFSQALPGLTWQPSDVDPAALASIAAWRQRAGASNLLPPITLDAASAPWDVGPVDAIFNANMVHISPIATLRGLMRGAGAALRPGGVLVMYGPFKVGGAHTAPSNARFDAMLRSQDARWGVRDLEEVTALAQQHGMTPLTQHPMPANNQTLVFARELDAT